MTAIALNLGFSNRHNNPWLNSTAASFTFEAFPEINLEETQGSGFSYVPWIKNVFGASVFSVGREGFISESNGEIIIETPLVNRTQEKLLLERQILEFLDLDAFDDEDAIDLLTEAVPEALVFIEELPDEIHLPHATVGLDGIVTLEWLEGAKKAAAMFEGEDSYGYAYYRNGRYVPGVETAVAGSGMPDDLKGYLTAA
jgi:hypothetical protein